jgi:hypothetical protein
VNLYRKNEVSLYNNKKVNDICKEKRENNGKKCILKTRVKPIEKGYDDAPNNTI